MNESFQLDSDAEQSARDENHAIAKMLAFGVAEHVAEALANAADLSDVFRVCKSVDLDPTVVSKAAVIVSRLNKIVDRKAVPEPDPDEVDAMHERRQAATRTRIVPFDYVPRCEAAKICARLAGHAWTEVTP